MIFFGAHLTSLKGFLLFFYWAPFPAFTTRFPLKCSGIAQICLSMRCAVRFSLEIVEY